MRRLLLSWKNAHIGVGCTCPCPFPQRGLMSCISLVPPPLAVWCRQPSQPVAGRRGGAPHDVLRVHGGRVCVRAALRRGAGGAAGVVADGRRLRLQWSQRGRVELPGYDFGRAVPHDGGWVLRRGGWVLEEEAAQGRQAVDGTWGTKVEAQNGLACLPAALPPGRTSGAGGRRVYSGVHRVTLSQPNICIWSYCYTQWLYICQVPAHPHTPLAGLRLPPSLVQVRSSGFGLLNSIGRLSSVATTLAAGWLLELAVWAPLVLAAALLAAGSVAMMLLPEPAGGAARGCHVCTMPCVSLCVCTC